MTKIIRAAYITAAFLTISASAFVHPLRGQEQAGGPSSASEQIVWKGRPHWRGSVPASEVTTFKCLTRTIMIETEYSLRDRSWRVQIRRLTIDGADIDRRRVETVNRGLETFTSAPRIAPECHDAAVRLSLVQVEHSRSVRTDYSEPLG